MIILDTNVISALMQENPPAVMRSWIDRQQLLSIYTCSIVLYELQFGIQNLASGKKQERLHHTLQLIISHEFKDRVIAFDKDSALLAGKLRAQRKQAGFNDNPLDIQVAAIAMHRGATLATRNVKDFAHFPVQLVNPWIS